MSLSRSYFFPHLFRDLFLEVRRRLEVPPEPCMNDEARIQAGYIWLLETIQATKNQGSSARFSYIHGWMPAFPETTGYIIPTLLRYYSEYGETEALQRAIDLAEWLQTRHNEDGGIQQGAVNRPARSIVFNTGMVLQGYTALYKVTGGEQFLGSAQKCVDFLVACQSEDGAWRQCTYNDVPHTYHARVAWVLLDFAQAANDHRALASGKANLDWVLAQQRANDYWDYAYFSPRTPYASTHSLGYIIEGLLESYLLLREEKWFDSARRAADRLLRLFERTRNLPAYLNEQWKEQKVVPFGFICLTGVAQIARCWLLLCEITGDLRYLNAAMNALDIVVRYQIVNTRVHAVRGALPGSAPVFGRYAPFQFPNWATKFLIDALFERRRALSALRDKRYHNEAEVA